MILLVLAGICYTTCICIVLDHNNKNLKKGPISESEAYFQYFYGKVSKIGLHLKGRHSVHLGDRKWIRTGFWWSDTPWGTNYNYHFFGGKPYNPVLKYVLVLKSTGLGQWFSYASPAWSFSINSVK